ncbi:hypothetical protein B0H10DRAFT_2226732 [Mycena sp. CBHHK59/15]|nr:hypothetical protein B0H10DRAFT_2226732 [Mycena sp. CBHHK59/15]
MFFNAFVHIRIAKQLKNRNLGLCTDGWKSQSKAAINALCANIDFRSFLIELLDVTALKKDGPSQCKQFAEMIDRVELQNGCIVIYFTTDADGGAKKGRLLLGKIRPWLILPSCWAHQFQLILGDYFKVNDIAAGIAEEATALIAWINNHGKVRKLFDASQRVISMDRNACFGKDQNIIQIDDNLSFVDEISEQYEGHFSHLFYTPRREPSGRETSRDRGTRERRACASARGLRVSGRLAVNFTR